MIHMKIHPLGALLSTAVIALTGAAPQLAQASSVTFSDRSLFEAELTSSTTIDFEDSWASVWTGFNTSAGYTTDGVNFVSPTSYGGHYLYVNNSTYGEDYAGLSGSGDTLLVEGRGTLNVSLPSAINAIAFDFGLGEGTVGISKDVTFALASGETFTWSVLTGEANFFGLIADSAFTGFSFKTTLDERPPQLSIDNVTFGAATVSAVPIPATLPLLLAAVGGLGMVTRRRKAA